MEVGRLGLLTRPVMSSKWFRAILRPMAKGLIPLLALCGIFFAQEAPQANGGSPPPGASLRTERVARTLLPDTPYQHRFWDKENLTLFATTAALNTADFVVTRSILQNGGRELDPAARLFGRSTAGLAVNFAGETVRVIGISYFFHKTGHHKLERIASMINIGVSAGAVTYDFAQ